jgi:hypothetical protein
MKLTPMQYENLIPAFLAIAIAAFVYYLLVQLVDWLYVRKQKRLRKERYDQQMEQYVEALRERNLALEDDFRQSALRESLLKEECRKLSGRAKFLAQEIMSDDMNKHTQVFDKHRTVNILSEELILE